MGRLENRTAVITGAAHGIGRAIAMRLAQEGARVAITDRDSEAGRALADEICSTGGVARFWNIDVTRETSVRRGIARITTAWGNIDVLVNNAGVMGPNRPTHEVRKEDWDATMAVNVDGVFCCTKAVVPHMLAAGGGSIINMCAAYGTVGAPNAPAYHASKGAVALMTKTDAMLYAAAGIRVNSIHPSFVATAMLDEFLTSVRRPDALGELTRLHPLGRIGTPDDVAWGAVYLASDESSFVTGSALVIDGGYTCR